MGPRTNLHVAIRPLRVLLCFYGFNVDDKVPKWIIWIGRIVLLIQLLLFTQSFYPKLKYKLRMAKAGQQNSLMSITIGALWLIRDANFWFHFYVFIKRKNLEQLISSLKRFSIGSDELFKVRVFFASALTLTFFYCITDVINEIYGIIENWLECLQVFCYMSLKCLLMFHMCCYISLLSLAYTLALFYSTNLNELMEGVKRSHSPLRRARLTTHLITHYYRVREVTTLTDTLFSTPLYWLKTTLLIFVSSVLMVLKFLVYADPGRLTVYAIRCNKGCLQALMVGVVLVTMIKANETLSQMLKCLSSCELFGAERSERLIRMRLDLLTQLIHLRMEQGPLTLAGEPLEGDFYYLMCIEINDMINYMHERCNYFPTTQRKA